MLDTRLKKLIDNLDDDDIFGFENFFIGEEYQVQDCVAQISKTTLDKFSDLSHLQSWFFV